MFEWARLQGPPRKALRDARRSALVDAVAGSPDDFAYHLPLVAVLALRAAKQAPPDNRLLPRCPEDRAVLKELGLLSRGALTPFAVKVRVLLMEHD